jgi:hypothetical protein
MLIALIALLGFDLIVIVCGSRSRDIAEAVGPSPAGEDRDLLRGPYDSSGASASMR